MKRCESTEGRWFCGKTHRHHINNNNYNDIIPQQLLTVLYTQPTPGWRHNEYSLTLTSTQQL